MPIVCSPALDPAAEMTGNRRAGNDSGVLGADKTKRLTLSSQPFCLTRLTRSVGYLDRANWKPI